jgi:hypothetical protein
MPNLISSSKKRINKIFRRKSTEDKSVENWELIGSANPKTILLGHSHRSSMANALTKSNNHDGCSVLTDFGSKLGAKYKPPTQEYWDFINQKNLESLKNVVVVWQGHLAVVHFTLRQKHNFKMLSPADLENLSNLESAIDFNPIFWDEIGLEMHRNLVKDGFKKYLEMFVAKELSVICLMPPPPKSNELVMKFIQEDEGFKNMRNSTSYQEQVNAVVDEKERVDVYEILISEMSKIAAEVGVKILQIPSQFRDKSGLLKSKYCFNDVSHANTLYAAEIWNEIERKL